MSGVRLAVIAGNLMPGLFHTTPSNGRQIGGQTNHVERWFNTLRQRLVRFTRKTLAFSKRQDLHDGLVHLFICDYKRRVIS